MKGTLIGVLGVGLVVATACGPSAPQAVGPEAERTCKVLPGDAKLRALEADTPSSSLALGRFVEGPSKGKTIAFVADADAHALTAVDVDAKKTLGSVKLAGEPSHVAIGPDGRVLVTLKSTHRLAVIHPHTDGSLVMGCEIETGAEPNAIAFMPGLVLISAGWGSAVDVLADTDFTRKGAIEVGREPRQIVPADDGKRAFVSHAIGGVVTVIDPFGMEVEKTIDLLADPSATVDDGDPANLVAAVTNSVGTAEKPVAGENMVRLGQQGFAMVKTRRPRGRLLLPQTLIDPGSKTMRNGMTYGGPQTTAVGNIGVIDAQTGVLAPASSRLSQMELAMMEGRRFNQFDEATTADCLLPRAVALHDESSTLLVACLGVDAVIAYDASSINPSAVPKIRWNVAAGPTGVAVDAKAGRAIVFSQFERTLEVLQIADIEKMAPSSDADVVHDRIELPKLETPEALGMLLGRQLFYSTGDARISRVGLGCAVCHVEGRDDGITWSSPDGPRRTLSLIGRVDETMPYGWDGESKELSTFMEREFQRLQGQGLKNVQMDSLKSYLATLQPPPFERGGDGARTTKGKALFTSETAGCNRCHTAGGSDMKLHDVGSRTPWDRRPVFKTPSLKNVAGRAPFFHDGRYPTLKELLEGHEIDQGGAKATLTEDDAASLEAYVRSL